MQPARGTIHTVGRITISDSSADDVHDDTNFHDVTGIIIEMSDEQVSSAAMYIPSGWPSARATVEVWPDRTADAPPYECTHENFAHLQVRLAAAEDNLAREVRSNQAAALVRARLEQDLEVASAERDTWRGQAETEAMMRQRAQDDLRHAEARHADLLRVIDERDAARADLAVCEHQVDDRNARLVALSQENERLAAELAAALSEAQSLRETIGGLDC